MLYKLALRVLGFVSDFYIPIIAFLVIVMIITGLSMELLNGLYGTKFDSNKIWGAILQVTGAGVLGLATKLSEFSQKIKYITDSVFNTNKGERTDTPWTASEGQKGDVGQ